MAYVQKIRETYEREGISAVLKKSFTFPVRYAQRTFKPIKDWVLGRLFEIVRNNKLSYKGVVLSFDDPYIPTKEKSNFLFGLGPHEENPTLYAKKYIDRDLPLVELGGSTGVVACITDKMITKEHIVVEANPYIIPILEKNKKVNGCHFTVVNKALGYKSTLEYYASGNPWGGSLYKKTARKIAVPGTTLETLAGDFSKINCIVDIEGAEIDLIDHEIDFISKRVAVLIIEFHPFFTGESEIHRVMEKLEVSGLHCVEKNENDAVFVNSL